MREWILMMIVGVAGCAGLSASAAAARLEQARAALTARDYPRGAALAREVRESQPWGTLREEANFVEAESRFLAGDYYEAYELYESLLIDFPQTERERQAIEREHQIGSAFIAGEHPRHLLGLAFGRESLGLEILEDIVKDHPYEDFSDDDQYLIGGYYFEREDYEEAEAAYRALIERFPESEWEGMARYQLARCILRQARGPRYDQKPLDEAREELTRYLRDHPQGAVTEPVRALLFELDSDQGDEALAVVRYYRREGRPLSALIYAKHIQQRYPGTEAARRAAELRGDLEAEVAEARHGIPLPPPPSEPRISPIGDEP